MFLALSNTGSKWSAIIPERPAAAPFSVTHQQFSPNWLRPARMLLAGTRGRSTTTGLVDCGPAQFRTSFQIGTAAVTVLCVQSILGFLCSTSLEFSEVCFPRATGGQRSTEKQSQHNCQRLLFLRLAGSKLSGIVPQHQLAAMWACLPAFRKSWNRWARLESHSTSLKDSSNFRPI